MIHLKAVNEECCNSNSRYEINLKVVAKCLLGSHIPFTLHFLSKAISAKQQKCRYKKHTFYLDSKIEYCKTGYCKRTCIKIKISGFSVMLRCSSYNNFVLNVVYFFYVCLCLFIIFCPILGIYILKIKIWKRLKMS